MKPHAPLAILACLLANFGPLRFQAKSAQIPETLTTPTNCVAEVTLTSEISSPNPFMDVTLDVLITAPDARQFKVPAFWAGGHEWKFRYASETIGTHTYRTECSDPKNLRLHAVEGKIEVVPYHGENSLYRHGPIQVAKDQKHFEHSDGTPFFWLGDTWWKNLSKRMTWEGFQELTADRQAKGFSVIQIVCGPYPDEGAFDPRWENEGGKPYETKDFSVVNPKYFDFADRRIKHLVDAGMVPAIVGGWHSYKEAIPHFTGIGWPNQNFEYMHLIGEAGFKRHWRNLIARYGAYPVVWIVGGEASGPQWTELARSVRDTDPYHRPATIHPPGGKSGRQAVTDESVLTFDMLQTPHGDEGVKQAVASLKITRSTTQGMPVLNGESAYEGHMQSALGDAQRSAFWGCMLNGAAGHTYGAAGVWHGSIENDPGVFPVWDWTTWRQGMIYPGSTQVGLGKKLLEKYPWWRFAPHPEWVEAGCFAAGIPGEVRFIYLPRRNIYNWSGPTVKNLEPDIAWHAYYFDPATGRTFDLGTTPPQSKPSDFKQPLPSPQDWVLVLEKSADNRHATISNLQPRRDIHGDILDAHDGCLEYFAGKFYLYGVRFQKGTGFENTNRFVCYSSPDLQVWTPHGEMLSELNANPRTFYQCYVKFNQRTGKYVLWYNAAGQNGVAVADRPEGPFTLKNSNVRLQHSDSEVGDLSLFVDDDGTGYLLCAVDTKTGFGVKTEPIPHHKICVEKLTPDYLDTTHETTDFLAGNCEGPSMFKRNGIYYLLCDNTCCYCPNGTGVRVYTGTSAMGPFKYRGNINIKADGARDLPSPWTQPGTGRADSIIKAQGKHVTAIPTPSGTVFLWIGDRWSSRPDGIKGHDFQYWSSPFQFENDGMIKQMKWEDQWSLELPQTPK